MWASLVIRRERTKKRSAQSFSCLAPGRDRSLDRLDDVDRLGRALTSALAARRLGVHEATIHSHLEVPGGRPRRVGGPHYLDTIAEKLLLDDGFERHGVLPVPSAAAVLDADLHVVGPGSTGRFGDGGLRGNSLSADAS